VVTHGNPVPPHRPSRGVAKALGMRIAAASIGCVLVAGCAHSGGVLKMGPDTYTASAAASPARGGISGARTIALGQANQHCTQMGKEILVTNVSTATINIYGAGSAEVTFRCLAKGDPEVVAAGKSATPGESLARPAAVRATRSQSDPMESC
jgi:hypothetical protein